MKSILDLCRSLPDSEPEIRERAEEFNQTIQALAPELMFRRSVGAIPNWDNIADAKAATDAMIAHGFGFELELFSSGNWFAEMSRSNSGQQSREPLAAMALPMVRCNVIASTMELAMSAAALLAAEAMKEK